MVCAEMIVHWRIQARASRTRPRARTFRSCISRFISVLYDVVDDDAAAAAAPPPSAPACSSERVSAVVSLSSSRRYLPARAREVRSIVRRVGRRVVTLRRSRDGDRRTNGKRGRRANRARGRLVARSDGRTAARSRVARAPEHLLRRERAGELRLELGRQRLLDAVLHAAQHERAQQRVRARERVGVDVAARPEVERGGERLGRREDVGEQEVEQAPELGQIVLHSAAGRTAQRLRSSTRRLAGESVGLRTP